MWSSLVETLTVVVAAASVIYGVNAWRHTTIGQRRIDLAEQVLDLFRQAREDISYIRSPFSFAGEGSTRVRGQGETEADAELLDRAFVAIERMRAKQETFAKLYALRHRFELYFGVAAARPFGELNAIMNEIRLAASQLSRYWRDQGRKEFAEGEFEKHLEKMHKAEAVFWEGSEDPDPIAPRLAAMIGSIDSTCGETVNPRRTIRSVIEGWVSWNRAFWKWKT